LFVAATPIAFFERTRMSISETYVRWRYRLVPDHIVGEVLSKNWIDNAIPVAILALVIVLFAIEIPGFFGLHSLADSARQLGEYLFPALGMTVVLLAGGIDLSVGSSFALCNFASIAFVNALQLPLIAVMPLVVLLGAAVGLINGVLVGYLRVRAFLATLVTLIFVRAIVDQLTLKYAVAISTGSGDTSAWDFVGDGTVAGVPIDLVAALVLAAITHIVLTRTRWGWHLFAVGGSRRSAYNVGISVRRTVCWTYVISGALTACGAIFYASRLNNAGSETGVGLEIAIVTAVVLGGNSLGGGRGSVIKTLLGTSIILLLTNGLVRLGFKSGAGPAVLGIVLLLAVMIDVRWLKNRLKLLNKTYVAPTYVALPPCKPTQPETGSPYAQNNLLSTARGIGVGELDGPEDIILDDEDNLYCGSRHGDIIRFLPPDYTEHEIYAHIGGFTLGLAFDKDKSLVVCSSGIGVFRVTPDREIIKVSDETNRSLWSIIDDSRMRLADDLDIAPDGRIFFSEATIRYNHLTWMMEALEGRGNGRIICYDPQKDHSRTIVSGLMFPNGICMTHDGQSFLFAETFGCRIRRYWFDGPKAGRIETVIPDLPGMPDNINRASDGNFWCAMCGMRAPALDLALRMPSFRRRMIYRVAPDEWLFPEMNTGFVFKFDLNGRILDALWDVEGLKHPMITSVREHRGKLYLGGLVNNRIGQYQLSDADPTWTGQKSYWGLA
jgi:ribose transport system permease protein